MDDLICLGMYPLAEFLKHFYSVDHTLIEKLFFGPPVLSLVIAQITSPIICKHISFDHYRNWIPVKLLEKYLWIFSFS